MRFTSIQFRLTFIFIGISFLTTLFMGAHAIYGAIQETENMLAESRKDLEESAHLQLEYQAHTAWSVVSACYQAQLRGDLTKERAMQVAADLVRNMRYDNGQGYFTIDTDEGVNVVLLGTEAEGKPRLDAQDPNGRYFIRETIQQAKLGGGFSNFMFPKPGTKEPLPKLYYTMEFAPYHWIIGTGIWNVGYLGTDFTYAGSFNNAATLNKYGEGVLTLTGSSSANMNVYEGILSLDNTTSTTTGLVKANKGGTVKGSGKSASVTVANGGMVGAGKGNSVLTGTLTLTGNLTVQGGGIILVRGRGTTSVDKFNVAGKVNLTNPVFQMERLSDEWEAETDYKIFNGAGTITISGMPTMVPETPKAGYVWDLSSLESDGIIRIIADPVGISEIMADPSKHVIYDMAGRRIHNIDRHGVYIVDGKKVTVK